MKDLIMPCRDYQDYQSQDDLITKAKLDKVTRLLCHTLGLLETSQLSSSHIENLLWTPELTDWWAAHKEHDALAKKLEAEVKARVEQLKMYDDEIAILKQKYKIT
jgi:arginine deiminase